MKGKVKGGDTNKMRSKTSENDNQESRKEVEIMKGYKKISTHLAMVLVGCFTILAFSTSAFCVEPVRVGVNIPLSGRLASMAEKGRIAMGIAADKVNKAGGIRSLGGAKLELLFADCETKPEVCGLETERLINKENVSVVIGALGSSLTLVGTTVAEKYQVPFVVWVSMSPKITKRGYTYTFRANENNENAVMPQSQFMKFWGGKVAHPVKSYFHIYINNAMGKTQAAIMKRETAKLGIKLVGSAPTAADISDFTPIMLKIKATKPDVLFMWQHEEEAILLTRALAENRINVPLIMSFSVFLSDPVLEAVGDLNEGWFQTPLWNAYMPKVSQWVAENAAAYKAASGRKLDGHAAQGFQCLYLVADALERAGSRDPKKIRDALASTNIGKDNRAYICGYPIKFGADGQNTHAFTAIMQTWKGKHYSVFPLDVADPDHKAVWRPTWTWLR